jgi:magnesium transporter
MLTKIPGSAGGLSDAVWIDLFEPSDEERADVERATSLEVPTKEAINEIESSSRVFARADALYLSTPVIVGTNCASDVLTTLGFVLSPKRLVTVRFSRVVALDKVLTSPSGAAEPNAGDTFLKVLEAIIDQAADTLEHGSTALDQISTSAFRREGQRSASFANASKGLHDALRQLGRLNEGLSHIRDTLLGFARITAFVADSDFKRRLKDGEQRLHALRTDISSLNDYQAHLANKVQFLLDATLGFINIQQNDIVKALTIVSVVGVPPVLIAGVYGMNFKAMPELEWPLGYPFALILIVVSALAPLAWFKWRDWI